MQYSFEELRGDLANTDKEIVTIKKKHDTSVNELQKVKKVFEEAKKVEEDRIGVVLQSYARYEDFKDLHDRIVPKVDKLQETVIDCQNYCKNNVKIIMDFDKSILTKANKTETALLKNSKIDAQQLIDFEKE